MFVKIVVPLDGSDFAEQALPWALSIARRCHACLDLVRAHVSYALQDPHASYLPFMPEEEIRWKKAEQLYLDGTAHLLTSVAPVSCTTGLTPSVSVDGVLQRILDEKADLVVMATHGKGMLGRFFAGSLSDELVRKTSIPILLIPQQATASGLVPEPLFDNVLIPLDGSSLAEQILGPAADLVRVMEGTCTLLRIVPPPTITHPTVKQDRPEMVEAQAYLDSIVGRLQADGVSVKTRIVVSMHPEEAILAEAKAQGSQLIALATHGRGGIGRLVMGSVASQLVQKARCPLLVYTPKAG